MAAPLAGLKVIELARILAGPWAGQTLSDLGCEVIKVDDFEAMRQTYKRNQHGTHNPVRLGQMFERMMAERKLSQRELAKDIEVSEGTIRNALDCAKAAKVRNSCAVEKLTVRQMRRLNELPQQIGDPDLAWRVVATDVAGNGGVSDLSNPWVALLSAIEVPGAVALVIGQPAVFKVVVMIGREMRSDVVVVL